MGSKSTYRKQFLSKHPTCCFCGGNFPAVEIDHIPSRVLFDNKHWPEGYEFPACIQCNRATRHDEQVVAMLSRVYPDAKSKEGQEEVQERIRAVAHNYPEVLEEMRPTARQVRSTLKKYGIEKPDGITTAELPFLSVSGPRLNAAIENFGRKLFCALFYKHTGVILPAKGGIAMKWFSNIQIENDEIPRDLAKLVVGFPTLSRSRTNLDRQFFYRYGISDTKQLAVFLAFFRQSFAILGYVNTDANDFDLPDNPKILRPFRVGT